MLFKKISHFLIRKSLGKELATALLLLHMIMEAVNDRKVMDVARFVYNKLPETWRQPQGPATEVEFVDMVQTGQVFLSKVKAVFDA